MLRRSQTERVELMQERMLRRSQRERERVELMQERMLRRSQRERVELMQRRGCSGGARQRERAGRADAGEDAQEDMEQLTAGGSSCWS
ncbi:hypothetical protein CesoFtcFv8_018085 [Champsocephalus esox]|uniref:Uncharacterized protein n=1 Tax=Champsocephalus esox TaxID=159716 RepID=A0AAN8GPA0_9TELE|nr:hypothetical protein CesoFtcFv8_018085 [Champsocephalus esox]